MSRAVNSRANFQTFESYSRQFTSDMTCQLDHIPERNRVAGMNLLNGARFTWDLNALPSVPVELPNHYQITPASNDDEKAVRKVISCSFLLDPAWNPAIA